MNRLRRSAVALALAASCAAALSAVVPCRALARPGDSPPAAAPASSIDFVRRALASNGELAAARLDLDRARARVRRAGARPNPTLDLETTTGRLTGSPGEGGPSAGVAVPLELFGQRSRRVELAEAALDAAEAALAERERRLAADVRARYAEALAAARELRILDELDEIDASTARFVAARVAEGESAPLEYRLLRVESDRLASRRASVEARYETALVELRVLSGLAPTEPVALAEDLASAAWPAAPATLDAALDAALRSRPDLRLARLEERVAEAGLSLARAEAAPDVTAFGRVSVERSVFDDTPVGALRDRDTAVTFGVSIGLPVFDRGRGAKDEAAAGVAAARVRREYSERRVRADVAAAFARLRSADAAAATFERGVIAGSNSNLRAIRGAYQIGAYRITELLAEQRRFVDLQREYVETLADRYRALSDLQSAIGVTEPFSSRPPAATPEDTGRTYPGLAAPVEAAPASATLVLPIVDTNDERPATAPHRIEKATSPSEGPTNE